jgi:hypothetical protein
LSVFADVRRNTKNPGGEQRFSPKRINFFKHCDEYLLGQILRLCPVSKHAVHEIVHRPLILTHEDFEGARISLLELPDKPFSAYQCHPSAPLFSTL